MAKLKTKLTDEEKEAMLSRNDPGKKEEVVEEKSTVTPKKPGNIFFNTKQAGKIKKNEDPEIAKKVEKANVKSKVEAVSNKNAPEGKITAKTWEEIFENAFEHGNGGSEPTTTKDPSDPEVAKQKSEKDAATIDKLDETVSNKIDEKEDNWRQKVDKYIKKSYEDVDFHPEDVATNIFDMYKSGIFGETGALTKDGERVHLKNGKWFRKGEGDFVKKDGQLYTADGKEVFKKDGHYYVIEKDDKGSTKRVQLDVDKEDVLKGSNTAFHKALRTAIASGLTGLSRELKSFGGESAAGIQTPLEKIQESQLGGALARYNQKKEGEMTELMNTIHGSVEEKRKIRSVFNQLMADKSTRPYLDQMDFERRQMLAEMIRRLGGNFSIPQYVDLAKGMLLYQYGESPQNVMNALESVASGAGKVFGGIAKGVTGAAL